ncbi:hypothetical protein K1718_13305 [Roseibium porphyridii]|uniref:HTH cro/C1-type domain-containing protein n=1 Tax=Roseibium porphyridii TaxID=2866279 RepID=A0ABY8FAE0_9HYPH|nr:hypothetical protein [Roseibium sp. KMA01]WFE92296.1 hypothetical protein K1718_13305 [Roseibium sp. KMA01]
MQNSLSPYEVAKVLQAAQERHGITYDHIADYSNLSPSTVRNFLLGRAFAVLSTVEALVSAIELITNHTYEELRSTYYEELEPSPDSIEVAIPEQSEFIRFQLSENGRLTIVPTLVDENDRETIEQIVSELKSSGGPLDTLSQRYDANPNSPQATVIAPIIRDFSVSISKPVDEINFTEVFSRGNRLLAAKKTADKQIASDDWPDYEASEGASIETVTILIGPLIMASATGRKLVAASREFIATLAEEEEEINAIRELGEVLINEPDLLEPDTAKIVEEITTPVPDDPYPDRSRLLRIAFTGSALVPLVGASVYLAKYANALMGAGAGAVTMLAAGAFIWEVGKKTKSFKNATDYLAEKYDQLSDAPEHLLEKHRHLLSRSSDLVSRNIKLFEKISNLRPEFQWVAKVLLTATKGPQPETNSLKDTGLSFEQLFPDFPTQMDEIKRADLETNLLASLSKNWAGNPIPSWEIADRQNSTRDSLVGSRTFIDLDYAIFFFKRLYGETFPERFKLADLRKRTNRMIDAKSEAIILELEMQSTDHGPTFRSARVNFASEFHTYAEFAHYVFKDDDILVSIRRTAEEALQRKLEVHLFP